MNAGSKSKENRKKSAMIFSHLDGFTPLEQTFTAGGLREKRESEKLGVRKGK